MVVPGMRAEEYGDLQRVIDSLFSSDERRLVGKTDLELWADINDLCADLREVVDLLPAGSYPRARLCDQLNSIICGHGWGSVYGTVE